MSQEFHTQQSKRRLPRPKRGRPGSKRPRTVFNIDDIATVGAPEASVLGETVAEFEQNPHYERQVTCPANSPIHNSISATKKPQDFQSSNESKEEPKNPSSSSSTDPVSSGSLVLDPDGESSSDSENEPPSNDETTVTNRTGPWVTWAENQHMLSDWVMDKLDKMITKSERDEERSLMNYFDEQIMMQQLWHNIRKTVDNEDDEDSNEDKSNDEEGEAMEVDSEGERDRTAIRKDSHKLLLQSKNGSTSPITAKIPDETTSDRVEKQSKGATRNLPASNEAASQLIENRMAQRRTKIVRWPLPKWTPKPFQTNDSDGASASERLFTPHDFETCVIEPLLNKLPQETCKIRILEECPNDKNSYLLEAQMVDDKELHDPKESWDIVQATTEAFVRSRISGVNLRWLLQDGASLEMDLSLSLSETLGVRFSKFAVVDKTNQRNTKAVKPNRTSPPGLWINRVEPNKGLATALGSQTPFCNGCALLMVNRTTICDPMVLRDTLKTLKAKANPVAVKICVSRHADLREISLSKLLQKYKLKRRDRMPIDVNFYPGLTKDYDTVVQNPSTTRALSKNPAHSSFPQNLQTSEKSQGADETSASKNLVHPSFPQHLQPHNKAEEKRGKKEKGLPSPKTATLAVHPSFRQHDQTAEESKVAEREAKENSKQPSQTASEKVIHPSETFTGKDPSKEKTAPESDSASGASSLFDGSSSDKNISGESKRSPINTNNKDTDQTPINVNGGDAGASSANKSAMTSFASEVNPDKKQSSQNQKEEEKEKVSVARNQNVKDPKQSESDNGHHISTTTILDIEPSTTQYNGTAKTNGRLERIEDKSVKKPVSSTLVSSTSASANSLPTNGEKTHGKESQSSSKPQPTSNGSSNSKTAVNIIPLPSQKVINHSSTVPSHEGYTAPVRYDPYEVALDPKNPLGGFFRTERGQNFHSKCVISSIFPGGQLNQDARIKSGTQVTAVMVGERRMNISNFEDVRDRYSDARHFRKNLRLILQNNHSCRNEPSHLSQNYWSLIGAWKGTISTGWAGGAPIESQSNGYTSGPKWDKAVTNARSQRNQHRAGSSSSTPCHNIEIGKTTASERAPSPTLGPFSPIAAIEDIERRPDSPPISGEVAFVDAIRNKSWKELIDVMEKGPYFSKEFLKHVLKNQYIYLDSELKKSKSSSTGTNSFHLPLWQRLEKDRDTLMKVKRNEDLEAKKKIIKLYINISHLIDKATSLRNWTEVTVEIKKLDLFHLPPSTCSRRSKVISTKVRKMNPDVDLCILPSANVEHQISYSTFNQFTVHNNFFASLDDRKIMVEIVEGDPKVDKVFCSKLGQFLLTLNEIESKW